MESGIQNMRARIKGQKPGKQKPQEKKHIVKGRHGNTEHYFTPKISINIQINKSKVKVGVSDRDNDGDMRRDETGAKNRPDMGK